MTGNPKEMEKENTTTGMKALGETGKTKKQQDPKAEKEAAVANSFKLTKARVETVKVTTKGPENGTMNTTEKEETTTGVENSKTTGPENGTITTGVENGTITTGVENGTTNGPENGTITTGVENGTTN